MTERIGTLLWEMRTAGGWSQGQVARAAGVSKAALSQWESGARSPRVPELEAALTALQADAAQRALVFAQMKAPRALRHLRRPDDTDGLGAPPVSYDLLRAMRLRKGWTQERTAGAVGVTRSAVARWEQGERLPATAQIQALCYALGAREDELIALTTGDLTVSPEEPTTWEAKEADLNARLRNVLSAPPGLKDLDHLALRREAWNWAARNAAARPMLARLCAYHGIHYRSTRRWAEAEPLAKQALLLVPRQEDAPDVFLRSLLVEASAVVYSG